MGAEWLLVVGVLLTISLYGFTIPAMPPTYRPPRWPRWLLMVTFVLLGMIVTSWF